MKEKLDEPHCELAIEMTTKGMLVPANAPDGAEFLDTTPLGTPEEERALARRWINTARMYAENAAHWRNRAEGQASSTQP